MYLVTAALAGLATLGVHWPALRLSLVPLAVAVAAPVAQAILSAAGASPTTAPRSPADRLKRVALTAVLHLMQPAARLAGRLRHGLTPWRGRRRDRLTLPRPRKRAVWSERWRSPEEWLTDVEAALRRERAPLVRGGGFDRWDLAVRGGLFGAARLLMAIEDHGAGRQYVRFKLWPRCSAIGLAVTGLTGVLAAGAAVSGAAATAAILGAIGAALAARTLVECSMAETALLRALPPSSPVATAAAGRRLRLPRWRRLRLSWR